MNIYSWKGIALSDSEGRQGQLGQEGHQGQEFPVSLHAKENIEKVHWKTCPNLSFCPNVLSETRWEKCNDSQLPSLR